jgi:hypothetical protein
MALEEQAVVTTYVAFDTRSGRILSVHHGSIHAKHAKEGARYHTQYHERHGVKISDEHVAVISVPSDAVEQGKQYKVDITRKALVAAEGKDGFGFGFGKIGRSSRS